MRPGECCRNKCWCWVAIEENLEEKELCKDGYLSLFCHVIPNDIKFLWIYAFHFPACTLLSYLLSLESRKSYMRWGFVVISNFDHFFLFFGGYAKASYTQAMIQTENLMLIIQAENILDQ